jgi:hypothetical protein
MPRLLTARWLPCTSRLLSWREVSIAWVHSDVVRVINLPAAWPTLDVRPWLLGLLPWLLKFCHCHYLLSALLRLLPQDGYTQLTVRGSIGIQNYITGLGAVEKCCRGACKQFKRRTYTYPSPPKEKEQPLH